MRVDVLVLVLGFPVIFTAYLHRSSADRCNSQRISVCPSVTFGCLVQTSEDMIVQFSASDSRIILVSAEVMLM